MIDKSVQSIIDFLVFSGKYQIIVHFYIKIRLSFTVIIGRQLLFISQRLYYIDFLHVLFQFGEQQADIYVFTLATFNNHQLIHRCATIVSSHHVFITGFLIYYFKSRAIVHPLPVEIDGLQERYFSIIFPSFNRMQ